MALGVLEFTGAAATWRAPALVVAGTEDPALLLGGEKKNRRDYLQKIGSRPQVESILSSSSL